MTYKLTVTTLALTAITSTVAATHAKPDTEHPHIVLIYAMIWDSLIYPATEEKYILLI